MSTTVSIKWRNRGTDEPGFHRFDDVLAKSLMKVSLGLRATCGSKASMQTYKRYPLGAPRWH
jgi:hypothetical protein